MTDRSDTPTIRCLISRERIQHAVIELGRQLSADYADKPLTILGVLTGSIMFVADLMREIQLPHKLGLIEASSYRGTATSPGELRFRLDALPDIQGRHVLLVDDIFDTGNTLTRILDGLRDYAPADVRSAVLLWKKSRTTVPQTPDYCCFEIPDEFVVGYGLDYDDDYRHLPYIGVLSSPSR